MTNSILYKSQDKNNLYATIIIFATILILFFVTTKAYSEYTTNAELNKQTQSEVEKLKNKLNELNDKKSKVESDEKTKKLIIQYAREYREDQILDQIYNPKDWISVNDISMEKGNRLPNGLNMASINISVEAKDVESLNKYIEYLTWEQEQIRFVIKNISFPFASDSTTNSTTASISLWMYYFDNK